MLYQGFSKDEIEEQAIRMFDPANLDRDPGGAPVICRPGSVAHNLKGWDGPCAIVVDEHGNESLWDPGDLFDPGIAKGIAMALLNGNSKGSRPGRCALYAAGVAELKSRGPSAPEAGLCGALLCF